MSSSTTVHEQVTDIIVRVVGCRADQVVPTARLKDLGVDSLTVVEIGEELGRRFDCYLSDDTIDGLETVQDAIDAVGVPAVSDPAPNGTGGAGEPTASAVKTRPTRTTAARRQRRRAATRLSIWLALVGAALGLVFGFGGAALVSATGLREVNLPPLTAPTTEATTASPSPKPQPAPTSSSSEPQPTLVSASDRVGPGERFLLSGAFPSLGENATLQVQVKDKDTAWDDFPITTKTRDGGKFKTEIYTSRTGERQFRMLHKKSDTTSPVVTVVIG